MSTRRDQLLTAAVRVLAASGPKALTHRAIDHEAGVPQGSAANHFRTRAALVDAVVAHLEALDLAAYDALGATGLPADVAALIDYLAGFAEQMCRGALTEPVRARMALVLGGVDVGAAYLRLHALLVQALDQIGMADADRLATGVLDYLDGLALHHLTLRREWDAANVRASLSALLRS